MVIVTRKTVCFTQGELLGGVNSHSSSITGNQVQINHFLMCFILFFFPVFKVEGRKSNGTTDNWCKANQYFSQKTEVCS